MRRIRLLDGVLVATLVVTITGCSAGDGMVAPAATTIAPPSHAPITTTPPDAASASACTNATALQTWTITRLAEQTIVVPVDAGAVLGALPEVRSGAGGVILFGSDVPPDMSQQLADVAAAAPGAIAPFVMTDEEGGAVQRLASAVGDLPSARVMGATMTATVIQQLAQKLGDQMRALGVTMDLAPVLDADGGDGPNNHDPDGTRSFSADPTVAATDGIAFADGLLAAGVVPVVKHFPGLGGASGNTDVVSATTQPWATLASGGLIPFARAASAGLPAVMVSNATVPGLTSVPASVSPAVITDVLRGQLGFDGLVITDSLSAVAITDAGYSIPSAAVSAMRAGADMTLFTADAAQVPSTVDAVVAAITDAVESGALSRARLQQSVARILTAKHVQLCA